MIKYSRKTNFMVQEITLDPTGTELTVLYKNRLARRLRADKMEDTLMVA